MPLQNRVDPWGNLVAMAHRGTLMGNRGILHNSQKQIFRHYQHQSWVTCLLEFKGRHRQVMTPKQYTELFFLDEATAFAAGHRPCGECRRQRYLEFKHLWVSVNLGKDPQKVKISEINRWMHQERVQAGKKVLFKSEPEKLPDGSMFAIGDKAFLVYQNNFYLWSFSGYCSSPGLEIQREVEILTPKSIVNIFYAGFKPTVHRSIESI